MSRILIVDDHRLVRDGLRRALTNAGHDVVGEAGDGAEAIELAERCRPELVLMDVSMPVLDGIEATARLLRRTPDARVVILTMHADTELVGRARSAGAVGYLVKDASMPEILEAVERVLQGGSVLAESVSRREAAVTVLVDEPDRPDPGLSSREEEVLQLLADGYAPCDVAKQLFISPNTVRNHLSSIYAKLDVGDRTQAVVEGLRLGLVQLTRAPT